MLVAATNRQTNKKEAESYTTASNASSRTSIARNNVTPESVQNYSNMGSAASSSNSIASGGSNTNITSIPWRSKINSLKNSFLGTPRFHRRKLSSGSGDSDSEDVSIIDSTSDLVKKSWFGSLTSGIGADRDDVQCIPVEGKSLNAIKAELIRAFLTV
jgi:BR serine/threonine kinase